MSVLVLSKKPVRQRPVDEWLAGAPVSLVTVTGAVDESVVDRFAEVVAVDDYGSWQVEIEAERLAARRAAELVASSSEVDVVRAARLRERLGLTGQSVASAIAYRDKLVMKRYARAAGIAVPEFAAVETPGDLVAFAEVHGFPVVVKPRRGGGSEGVHVLRSAADLVSLLGCGVLPAAPARPGEWMAESFVDGVLCHVDGLAAGGRILHCWPSRYSGGNAEAVRDGVPLTSAMLAPQDGSFLPLLDHAAAVLDALPHFPLPTSFHLEAWLPHDGGAPVLCEAASRTGGAFVADVYAAAFGVHLSKENLRGQAGLPVSAVPAVPVRYGGWVAITPRQGTFTPPAEPCPVPGVRLELTGVRGTGAVHAGDSVATVVVEGADAAQVRERISAAVRWWDAMEPWR
ncbi:hypothetical protein FKR81_28285 [Lentzea tibetensis]|uniref:ATP-grasp domain-containing protein n=1 Tax=Lentzea tibetensis TaxID=2591470 RepID=A0A563ENB6_9PSEU|nr:hypothetical protein [Lentzea tibetensis]TWP48490.1 hypothetical protein FKR81_28285 [Lentzea tibetensis]